jgi:hypothetical protein
MEYLLGKIFFHQSVVGFSPTFCATDSLPHEVKNMLLNRQVWNTFEQAKNSLVLNLKRHPETLTQENLWQLTLMTPQERGPLMEKRHIVLHSDQLQKVKASLDKGDFTNGAKLYCEYKFSIMGDNQKCNFVQIRPHQNVDYVLEVYDTHEDDLLRFFVPHKEMDILVSNFGGLAHGTIKTNVNKHKEYALRPSRKGKGKAAKAWEALQQFQVDDETLERIYSAG